ncbi:hypothetical protein [Caldivirga sp.]|uniref:hypothetical protein n=1 Tax=Caldivirga sp. TaxID=2080243 RepID=UPI003D0D7D9C
MFEYIPVVILAVILLAAGLTIIYIGLHAVNLLTEEAIIWSQPLPYQGEWIIQVNLIYPNPITPPLHPGNPRGAAWGWGVRKHAPFIVLKQVKFTTTTGVEPGYALECGNYTVDSVYVEYCVYAVKAYPIKPLIGG